MYTPFSENDQNFVEKAIDQGMSVEDAQNLLSDFYQEMEADASEEE